LYRPVGRSVLAFNARVGIVGPLGGSGAAIGDTSANVLHPTARFYAGGAQSVRGFGENQLGPRVLTIPPEVLRGSANQCPLTTPIQQCAVNGVPYLNDGDFSPQALGGRTLLEGSVEYRFPLVGNFGGAIFVDGGIVGQGNLHSATSGTGAITPGFGVRYYSLIGPIRVDVGLDPLTTEHLVVLTETAAHQIVVVTGPAGAPDGGQRVYAPARTESGLRGVLNRVSLHLSIGQAF
jgi:outer membrane protein assembly factor BamA